MGAPERLGHGVGDAGTAEIPSGPALNPIVTPGIERAPRDVTGLEPGAPVPVVFLGHFDDPRAVFCTATASPPCSRRFVVDMMAVVNGTLQSQIVWNGIGPEVGVTPQLNADVLHPLVERAMGSRTVLTSLAVTTPDGLDRIDPRILRFQPRLPRRGRRVGRSRLCARSGAAGAADVPRRRAEPGDDPRADRHRRRATLIGLRGLVGDAPGGDGQQHAARQRAAEQRRVLALRRSASAVTRPAPPSGRRRRGPPARPRRARRAAIEAIAEDARRPDRERLDRPGEREPPGVDRREHEPERGLDAADPVGRERRTRRPCRRLVCGAWSVAIASTVPSASAARQASGVGRRERSGGLTRSAGSYGRRDDRAVAPRVGPAPSASTRPTPSVARRRATRRSAPGGAA